MYKKIVSYLVFSLFVPLVALCADDPSRARLYIPASTSATVSGCTTCELKVSGYSARYIFGFGLGLGVTSSKASVSGNVSANNSSLIIADYSYDSGPMIDISYTFGSDFTFTVGYGVGSSPTSDLNIPDDSNSKDWKLEGKSASSSFLGLGYKFGIYEVLLALRSVDAAYDQSYTFSGIPLKFESKALWNTTDIGIGFTF